MHIEVSPTVNSDHYDYRLMAIPTVFLNIVLREDEATRTVLKKKKASRGQIHG